MLQFWARATSILHTTVDCSISHILVHSLISCQRGTEVLSQLPVTLLAPTRAYSLLYKNCLILSRHHAFPCVLTDLSPSMAEPIFMLCLCICITDRRRKYRDQVSRIPNTSSFRLWAGYQVEDRITDGDPLIVAVCSPALETTGAAEVHAFALGNMIIK